MESIIEWLQKAMLKPVPILDLSPLSGKMVGKLRLSPEQLLSVIHGQALAEWALSVTSPWVRPRLKRGPGGRPAIYRDSSILLMAVVQTAWRKSYEQIVDYVRTHPELAQQLGFARGTISQGQYWERRVALGALPFLFFFIGLVGQLTCPFGHPKRVRLGVITGKELIVDATLLDAWYHADPGATWQKYAKKASRFGYKVHTVLCHHSDLPVFLLVTPAHVHDSQVGWFVILATAVLYEFQVLVVYADAAYSDWRMFKVVHDILGAHPAVNYNVRRAGKRKLATLFFSEQWRRLVINPRTGIERHFAWVKRYFGLKYFQCFTRMRVTQFVCLTYIATLAVALAAERYQRPELHRSRSMVLANL
jgi:hypothetical protein